MEDKHTQGPWSVGYKHGSTHIFAASGESLMCDETYYPWVPKNMADWDLIAAAPDLLGALEVVRGIIHNGDDPDGSGFFDITAREIEQVYAAIAKAKGQIK